MSQITTLSTTPQEILKRIGVSERIETIFLNVFELGMMLYSYTVTWLLLRVLIYKQPDIETQFFWAHFLFCCPIPTTPHGGQS